MKKQSGEVSQLTPAQAHILQVVSQLEPVRPDQLVEHPDVSIGRVMLQRHLKKLHDLGFLQKSGQVPLVFYSTVPAYSFRDKVVEVAVQMTAITKSFYHMVRA